MIKKADLFPTFYEIILIFLIIFAPLHYGSALPFYRAILQLVSFSLLFVFLIRLAVISQPKVIYPASFFFIICFFAVILFQLIPFSQDTIRTLSPKAFQLYRQYLPSMEEGSHYTLSIYPFATKREFVKLFAAFALFFVTLNVMNNRRRFERIIIIIIFWAAGLSLYGIMKKFFMFGGWAHGDAGFSTISHRNLYAGYMVMIAPLSIGYVLACRDRYKQLFFGFLGAIISVSIFISASRGGAISLILALLVLLFLSSGKFSIKKNLWMIAVIIIFIVALSVMGDTGTLQRRLSDLFGRTGFSSRWVILKDSLPIVKDFPLFGVGLGNGRYIYTQYKTIISGTPYYQHLHNDHFQLLVESGFIASIFCFLFFITVFKDILIRLRKTQDPFVRNVVAGGVSGLFAITLHAFFDSCFSLPASLFMFWLILGLVYKCAHTNFVYERDKT